MCAAGQNASLRGENTALREENGALRKAPDEARRGGKRQAGPFSRNNPKPNPKTPGRKGGSEYGAVSRRAAPKRIDRKVDVPCPFWCSCGREVKLAGVVSQFQTDIPAVEPSTVVYAIQYGRCTKCGLRVQGRDPGQTSDAAGAVGGVQIGPRTIALAARLNKACGLSYERIMDLFAQVFGLLVSRSALARAMLRLGGKGEATYQHLIEVLRKSPIVYPDETGWRVGGVKAWLSAMTTVTETVYLIERGRGFPEAAKILGELFAGILGCDGWAPYRRFAKAERELCLAHLLRRCKELLEAHRPRSVRTISNRSKLFSKRLLLYATAVMKEPSRPMDSVPARARSKRRWTGSSTILTFMTRAFASLSIRSDESEHSIPVPRPSRTRGHQSSRRKSHSTRSDQPQDLRWQSHLQWRSRPGRYHEHSAHRQAPLALRARRPR